MNHEPKGEVFSYSYSAKQQEEIRKIREKYVPKEADKMEQLRRLDASVTRKGTLVSIVVGTVGSLVMGAGMSMCLVGGSSVLVPGIAIGTVGIAGVAAAYPLYAHITKRERERVAPEIIRLTDELMK